MVDLAAMQRVLRTDGDLVTVEAGITLHRLGIELAARGLALPNQGDIDAQTLAGATATATHGTGARFRNLSAAIAALRLVTAAGEVLDVGEDDPETLQAARVSLGALGVVSAITLRCVPRFTLHRHDAPRPLGETLDRLDDARRPRRPLRVLGVPVHAHRAHAHLPPQRRAAEPAARLAPPAAGGRAREPRARARLPDRPRGAARRPAAQRARHAGDVREPRRGPLAQRVRDAAARAVQRDGVRDPARARARGDRADAGRDRAPAAADRVPARGALRGRRRRAALHRPRPRHVLRRRAPVPRHGVRDLLPRGRGDHGRLRGTPALGQAPLPDRRDPGGPLSAVGRASSACATGSIPAACSPTRTCGACSGIDPGGVDWKHPPL